MLPAAAEKPAPIVATEARPTVSTAPAAQIQSHADDTASTSQPVAVSTSPPSATSSFPLRPVQEDTATAAAPSTSTAAALPHTAHPNSSTTAAAFSWNPLPVESFARQVSQQLAESAEVPSVDLEIKPLDLNSKRRSSEELPSTRGADRTDQDVIMRSASHPLVRPFADMPAPRCCVLLVSCCSASEITARMLLYAFMAACLMLPDSQPSWCLRPDSCRPHVRRGISVAQAWIRALTSSTMTNPAQPFPTSHHWSHGLVQGAKMCHTLVAARSVLHLGPKLAMCCQGCFLFIALTASTCCDPQ